jgi:hypothetical protein
VGPPIGEPFRLNWKASDAGTASRCEPFASSTPKAKRWGVPLTTYLYAASVAKTGVRLEPLSLGVSATLVVLLAVDEVLPPHAASTVVPARPAAPRRIVRRGTRARGVGGIGAEPILPVVPATIAPRPSHE